MNYLDDEQLVKIYIKDQLKDLFYQLDDMKYADFIEDGNFKTKEFKQHVFALSKVTSEIDACLS